MRALAIAVSVVVVLLAAPGMLRSLFDRLAFQRALHPDRTEVVTATERQVPGKAVLVYRHRDGEIVRALADGATFSAFVRREVARLESARAEAMARAEREIRHRSAPVFDDVEARIPLFADWYFAWSTSYELMGRAVSAIAAHAFRPEVMALDEAVAFDLESYLERRYRETVLRPEVTDAGLSTAYHAAFLELHQGFRADVARFDENFQAFIGEHTRYLNARDPRPDTVTFDWDHQARRLPSATLDRGMLEVTRGTGLGLAGGMVGRAAGAGVGRAVTGAVAGRSSSFFARGMAARVAGPHVARGFGALAMASVGAAAGPAGAVLGGAAGIGADWLVNESIEALSRDQLEAELQALLELQRAQWSATMVEGLRGSTTIWYEDLIELLTRYDA